MIFAFCLGFVTMFVVSVNEINDLKERFQRTNMNPLVLLACLSPIVIIWVVMKLSLWIFAVNDERKYVRAESKKPHGLYVADAYAGVDEEEEEYGDRTDFR